MNLESENGEWSLTKVDDVDPHEYVTQRENGAFDIEGTPIMVLGDGPTRSESDRLCAVHVVDIDPEVDDTSTVSPHDLLHCVYWVRPSNGGTRHDFGIVDTENMIQAVAMELNEDPDMNILWKNDHDEKFAGHVLSALRTKFGDDRIQPDGETREDALERAQNDGADESDDPDGWPYYDQLPDDVGRCSVAGRQHKATDVYKTDDGALECSLCNGVIR
ncbi:hypothetical protein [Natrinema versiforme]|uniref:Uncharacterized protein n=1 Tax=Natrinema versiforme JCM 10478 TaxID=1227496 RepID=L9Y7H0_9EURY|nr:hypothetical protein [Natrinema versiforme]ELY68888.1 hypothetical protein C489_05963 [Natrinema versiforme JCM 10478]